MNDTICHFVLINKAIVRNIIIVQYTDNINISVIWMYFLAWIIYDLIQPER